MEIKIFTATKAFINYNLIETNLPAFESYLQLKDI